MITADPLRVVLATPRGFCAGVVRAVEIVEQALRLMGPPVYVRHEIVHNHRVVESLRARGAVFVDEVDKVPDGAVTVFSAHGVSREVERAAEARGLDVIDATCPLVLRVHREGRRYAMLGYDVLLVGHEGHAEVEGTRGQVGERLTVISTLADVATVSVRDPQRVAYITQTTLSVTDTRAIIAALRERFPAIVGPDTRDICYATQNRQNAVLQMAPHIDFLVVLGSANSSNSNRLREIGETSGVPSRLVGSPDEIDPAWFAYVRCVGITAGASAPESLVSETIARLATFRAVTVESMPGPAETVQFRLPARLAGEARLMA
jgi:4-hydroxy-3-methylbut-2-enyl diphosphate reductase